MFSLHEEMTACGGSEQWCICIGLFDLSSCSCQLR